MSENKHTKRIPLTQGQFAIVDDADFELLSKHKWWAQWCPYTQSYYAVREVYLGGGRKNRKRKSISMARQILGLEFGDNKEADHINHITLDNRKSNLRIVTPQQNRWNQKNPKGYYWRERDKKYEAYIRLNGKLIFLGSFLTAVEAHSAYLKAKQKYHKFGR